MVAILIDLKICKSIVTSSIHFNGADQDACGLGDEAKLSASTYINPVPRIEEATKKSVMFSLFLAWSYLYTSKSEEVEIRTEMNHSTAVDHS